MTSLDRALDVTAPSAQASLTGKRRDTPGIAFQLVLLGSLPFRFGTLSGVAGQLLSAEQLGLGFDFLDKYRKEVEAVTAADVQDVARRHLDPRGLTIVAVGPIDPSGAPLAAPKKKK